MAQKAANSPQCCILLDNALDSVAPHIHDLLNASTSAMNELCKDKENVDPNVQQVDELLRSAWLKKKEVQSKNLRRKKTWLDKLLKGKHRVTKGPTKQGEKPQRKKDGVQQKKKDGVQPQVEVEKYDNNKEINLVLQECNNIMSFTQLLTADHDNLF
ncbi:hypothetical protein VPH35_059880 [Triticum aestivum]|uniref:Uncharacterized protein n=1 Tax=Aegilops tauschii subsp. strangulata TaxID=200361 RepID=A0A453EYX8_AEGTS|nr:uncharacterized protein LOC109752644 [Aegilops tauschii subsp. strangulata]